MKSLRKAAGVMLQELEPTSESQALQIERITCEVRGPQRTELVSLRIEQGRLLSLCTCGESGCAHVAAALRLLAADPGANDIKHSRSDHPPPEPRITQALGASLQLADALADVVTAVVRAGVCSDRIASVLENLSRVERALPEPLPLGLLRWLGRMREAIDAQDTALAAQALGAAAAVSTDLRSSQLHEPAQARLCSWFGPGDQPLARLSDRSLVEVARECLHGNTRNQIERRYLVDLESGECFREESVRGERAASVGPCPRLIGVSLAEIEPSCGPRRLRLLQYTTTPDLQRAHWDNLAAWGQRDSEALLTSYRAAIAEFGALAEPFALTAPRGVQREARPSLLFERGAPLPIFTDDDPGLLKHCERLSRASTLVWVAGRLLEHAGQLMLRPLALGLQDGSGLRYERL
ncbi:MAG TPA: hypothetical protein VFN67_09970 [Polyangiales bacterium]|nr:hypothetical protein [Polyangiales bacterium]